MHDDISLKYSHLLGRAMHYRIKKLRGIRWTLFSTLEGLDFMDNIVLLSHTHRHMQEKTSLLSTYAHHIGLSIRFKKIEVMTLNTPNPAPIKVEGEDIPTTEQSTNLGRV